MTMHDDLFAPLETALKPVYQLIRRLGEGGMGAVYHAREPALKRDVAVKIMLPWLARDEVSRARFDREAQAVAAISHPNVINIYGTGELADGTPYFVMQYVAGRGLEERIAQDGPLSLREARRVLAEVAAALSAAHARGIIHRDIKAANVLQDAASGRAIVTDFGIAAVRTSADVPSAKLTNPDFGSPGTPFYMAPEQLVGEETTEASDIYAFGLLAYELLTGQGPFNATSPHEIAAAHLRDVPDPLTTKREDVDADLEHLVASCLHKDPKQRPDATELMRRLPPSDVFALEWPPPGLEPLAGRMSRANRATGLGAAMLCAALLNLMMRNPADLGMVPLWVLEAAAFAGVLALVRGLWLVGGVLRLMRRAMRQGYPWFAVLEVAVDRRGDTGALITGVRDYAPLARATRSRLRAGRLAASACGFGAAIMPLLTLVLMVRVSSAGGFGPLATVLAVALPPVLLLTAAAVFSIAENRAVPSRRDRRRRKRTPDIGRTLVKAWAASFDDARAGQALGARAPHPLLTRTALRSLIVVLALAIVTILPLAVLPMIGSVFAAVAVPKLSSTAAKYVPALAGRPWAAPPDSTISATDAGRALHALTMLGDPRAAAGGSVRRPEPLLSESFISIDGNPFGSWTGLIQDSLLRLGSRHAFTRQQVAWLEGIASHPGWVSVRTAGRAPRIDVAGTRYSGEQLARSGRFELDFPLYGEIKSMSYAASAVAALRLSQGRAGDAEMVLREAAGVGINLIDNGIFLIETLIGASIANNALDRLATLYDITGRQAEAAALRSAREAARARAERMNELNEAASARYRDNPTGYLRSLLLAAVADSTAPASFRWEFVRLAADQPCLGARELVFGPQADLTQALAIFERQVVRTPGDSAWFANSRKIELRERRPLLARAWARALGNQRVGACLSLLMLL